MRTFGLCCKKNVRGGGMGRSRLLFDRFERQTKASIMRGLRLHALLPVALDDGDPAIAEKGDSQPRKRQRGRWYISREARRTTDSAASQLGSGKPCNGVRVRGWSEKRRSSPSMPSEEMRPVSRSTAMAMPPAWKLSTALSSVAERSVAMRICTASRSV